MSHSGLKVRARLASWRSAFAGACFLVVALGGCGRGHDHERARDSSITVLTLGDERDLGPAEDRPSKFLVFLPLVARNAKGELEGRLAESWEHSPDYRTWTIHLRKDVHWQDGVPVTAHDIKFTMDLLSNPDAGWESPGAYSVTILDESTYTVTYHQGADGSPLDDYTVYYPKHLLEKLDPKKFYEWEFWTQPVGDGPYRYVRHVPKTMIELQANPNYYRGKPKIERVVLKFGDTFASGSVTELLSGNVDAVDFVNWTNVLKLAGDPRFRVYDSVEPLGIIKAILWNHRYSMFRDPRVRRALTLAINRQELQQVLSYPEKIPIFDVPYAPDQLLRRELPEPLPYEPEQAKRMLDEAGWRVADGDRIRHKGGKRFHFTALVPSLFGADKAAVYIQAQLGQVGIQMDIANLDREAGLERLKTGEFEAAIFAISPWVEGDRGYQAFFGEHSLIGYSNPRVLTLLEKAAATSDPDEADRVYRELWPIFEADVPVTFYSPAVFGTIARRRVRGLDSCPHRGDVLWCMENLWLDDRGDQ